MTQLIRVDSEDSDLLKFKWSISHGYATRWQDMGCMHRYIMSRVLGRDLLRSEFVDHENRNRLDNRRENLRLATKSQNMMNTGAQKGNKSGYKGVFWHKRDRKWIATITLKGTRKFRGYFDTPEDAARAWNAAALELHGEFAYQNEVIERKI